MRVFVLRQLGLCALTSACVLGSASRAMSLQVQLQARSNAASSSQGGNRTAPAQARALAASIGARPVIPTRPRPGSTTGPAPGSVRNVPLISAILRDPFREPEATKPGNAQARDSQPRPAGVRGLLVNQLRLQGIIREEGTQAMIAMVTNQTNLSYFLRENDQLFDGVVSRITPDVVYIRQKTSDTKGSAISGEVVLHIEPVAGGQK